MAGSEQIEHSGLNRWRDWIRARNDRRCDGIALNRVLSGDVFIGCVETRFEALNTFTKVAHEIGDFSFSTEQEQSGTADEENVPNAESAHEFRPLLSVEIAGNPPSLAKLRSSGDTIE
jgi:propanediol dehydratase small subunit